MAFFFGDFLGVEGLFLPEPAFFGESGFDDRRASSGEILLALLTGLLLFLFLDLLFFFPESLSDLSFLLDTATTWQTSQGIPFDMK